MVIEPAAVDATPSRPDPSIPSTPTPLDPGPIVARGASCACGRTFGGGWAGPRRRIRPPVDQHAVGRDGRAPAALVLYPSGVILQPDPTLYSTEADEEYVRLPEPEADELGQERDVVIYSTSRAR